MAKIKFAFHVHTSYSKDGHPKPEAIVEYCRKNGIDAVAITDHNEIKGAEEAERISQGNPKIIKGEEVATRAGEVIGLFLKERIDPGLGLQETVEEIKRQGGLVCIPHPGESFRQSAISKKRVREIIGQVDVVEVYNSRTLLGRDNSWAKKIAQENNKAGLIGSDAHFVRDISKAINLMDDFEDKESFLRSATRALPHVYRRTGLWTQGLSKIVKLYKKHKIRAS